MGQMLNSCESFQTQQFVESSQQLETGVREVQLKLFAGREVLSRREFGQVGAKADRYPAGTKRRSHMSRIVRDVLLWVCVKHRFRGRNFCLH